MAKFSRSLLIVLMFVGGCAGSTGGMKVIRHILLFKILHRSVEHSNHPSVVNHIRLGGESIVDPDRPQNTLLNFGLIALIVSVSSQVLFAILVLMVPSFWPNR